MKRLTQFTRGLKKTVAMVVGLLFTANCACAADTGLWGKTFPKSDDATHEKVSFHNRFRITVAADMYLPKDMDKSKKHAAIIVGTPYGGVKEQGAGIYAQAMAFMNFPLLTYTKTISPRPILFIIGEKAHSRYFSEDAYKMAADPKELYVVPVATHVDLYDRVDVIPWGKLNDFFTKALQ